jgi:hypothetical protein
LGNPLALGVIIFSLLGCADFISASQSKVETPYAIIFYPLQGESTAKEIASALEFAHHSLADDLGFPTGKVRVYIYSSSEEMVYGLMKILGYDRKEAEVVARVGISAYTKTTMHVHLRTKTWGPTLWHAVVHEYAHGLAEERYGVTLLSSARWLYEGLGEYEAWRALRLKLKDFEAKWSKARLKLAFKALIFGKLPRLESISTQAQWYENMIAGRQSWDIQYAAAYAAVRYIVDQQGFEMLQRLLEEIKKGSSFRQAVQKSLGISAVRFEFGFRTSLFIKGVLELYAFYTAVLFSIVVLTGIFGARLLRWKHRRRD